MAKIVGAYPYHPQSALPSRARSHFQLPRLWLEFPHDRTLCAACPRAPRVYLLSANSPIPDDARAQPSGEIPSDPPSKQFPYYSWTAQVTKRIDFKSTVPSINSAL